MTGVTYEVVLSIPHRFTITGATSVEQAIQAARVRAQDIAKSTGCSRPVTLVTALPLPEEK